MRFSAASALCSAALLVQHHPRCPHPLLAESDGPDPESWREFRAKLISGGLKVTTDGDDGNNADAAGRAGGEVTAATASAEAATDNSEASSVAPANEELLKSQNEALWREYLDGAWAHAAPGPEPGGLLCRAPLQAQLTWLMRRGSSETWPDKLRERLLTELPSTLGVSRDEEENAAAETGAATTSAAGDNDGSSGSKQERLLAQWSANTAYTYRLAEGLIGEGLQEIAGKSKDGRVSLANLNEEQKELISLYSNAQESWQEVALVLALPDTSEELSTSGAECVVINRPIARTMNKELAQLLLNGTPESRPSGVPALYDERFVDKFLQAFGSEAAVYVGGPDAQEQPGLVVHGVQDLVGANELAPGTRIYTGGIDAIVDAVISGDAKPLDFRWFVGRRRDISTAQGAWRPVACARPVALKQCLGLPKPLWHEVLELCGGELAELSRIELLKRADLE